MRRLRVLLLTRPMCPPWDEGSKNFGYRLVQAMPSQFGITVLTCQAQLQGLPQSVRQLAIHSDNKFNFWAKKRLLKHVLLSEYDLIHVLSSASVSSGITLRAIAAIKHIPVVQTVSAIPKSRFGARLAAWGNICVAYSNATSSNLVRAGVKNVEVIPPAVDFDKFMIGTKKKVIAFLGELHRVKSFELTRAIIEDILDRHRDCIVVAGFRVMNKQDGERRLVEALKQAFGHEPRVQFPNVINDMASFLSEVATVVFPANSMEGKFDFPLVLLEALASGTQVIISPISPLTELGVHNGVSIPSENTSKGFGDAIEGALSRQSQSLSTEIRGGAKKHFDVREIALQYGRLYEEIGKIK